MIKNLFTIISFLYLHLFLMDQTHAQDTPLSGQDTLNGFLTNLGGDVSVLKKLTINGYLQPQFQYVDSAGAPSVAGGDFVNGTNNIYSRFTMRRGRVKFTYRHRNIMYLMQPDITEKGFFMMETYVRIFDPWFDVFQLTVGCLQVPFGFELAYSSNMRETPERARYNQTLFPKERDLGVFLKLNAPKNSFANGLSLEVSAINGSGLAPEFDNNKDYTGRLQYQKTSSDERLNVSLAGSYYGGKMALGKVKDYVLDKDTDGHHYFGFSEDTANYSRSALREYSGADIQVTLDWFPGITTLRAEYIQGIQPGTASSSRSHGAPPTGAIYKRNFNGAYFYLIQNLGKSPFQFVLKYDFYDPNIFVSGMQIGEKGTNTKSGDVRFDTYGAGLNINIQSNIKLVLYYDLVVNEKTQVAGYTDDLKDNVFTARMQFKF